jgi:hypothetical protein
MAITTYNTEYYDDYTLSDNNEKNFLRILFKPGYSVQVRELNQLQSILQSQIDKFGSSLYVEGSAIVGGNTTFDTSVEYIDVLPSNVFETEIDNVSYVSNSLVNTSILTADVIGYKKITIDGIEYYRLYLRYDKNTQDSQFLNVNRFTINPLQSIIYKFDPTLTEPSTVTLGTVAAAGYAAGIYLDKSIFYTKGSFVHTAEQKVFIDGASQTEIKSNLNGSVILDITEEIVNYTTDSSLLDNANGTPNWSAPGADRYTINLELKFLTEGEINTLILGNSINLLAIKNSIALDSINNIYSKLDTVLAKRTFEESGDYILSPFKIGVREFLNKNRNGGRYSTETMPSDTYSPDDTTIEKEVKGEQLYSMSLDPAIAYVKGYRIEPSNKIELYALKAREVSDDTTSRTSAAIGNYVQGSFAAGSQLPNISNCSTTYTLFANDGTIGYPNGSPDGIGTCRIRAVESSGGTSARLYIYDIVFNSSSYSMSNVIRISNGSVIFNLTAPYVLNSTQYNTNLFRLPYDTIANVTDMTYSILRHVTYTNGNTSTVLTGEEFFDDIGSVMYVRNGSVVSGSNGVTVGNDRRTISFPAGTTSAILPIFVETSTQISRLKTKKITSGTQSFTLSPSDANQKLFTLSTADIINITSVKLVSNDPFGTDITSNFSIFDNGQRDTHFKNPVIKNNSLSPFIIPSQTTLTIFFNYTYFEHSAGDYATVNSYKDSNNNNLSYDSIPSYKGVRLSDYYDFRPVILINGSSTVAALNPDTSLMSKVQYHLPRVDAVVVNTNGQFNIITGKANTEPQEPILPSNSLLLYRLKIPAYTFTANEIGVEYIDNKRYTMKDIGNLEKRIGNLEYYTSLTLLEKSANDISIVDENTALERFKNGIIVDNFSGHSVGDASNLEYACSIDTDERMLRPKYTLNNIRLKPTVSNGIVLNKNTATLNFNEVNIINQRYYSEATVVNPNPRSEHIGHITLIPSTDEWKDTTTRPDVIINDDGKYDAIELTAEINNIFGTYWNEWEINWIGKSTLNSNRLTDKQRLYNEVINASTERNFPTINTPFQLNYIDIDDEFRNRIVDISYIPYIRSRKIYFKGVNLKPNSRVYTYFDGIDVTTYCNQLTNIPNNASTIGVITSYEGKTSEDDNILFPKNNLVTDSSGEILGEFIIPNNDILKFKSGKRSFVITDSPSNDALEATTFAENQYIANGILQSKSKNIVSVREPERVLTRGFETTSLISDSLRYNDPIAQIFKISDILEGLFLTSIDLYFITKSSASPISVCIVEVEDGSPTHKILPFSKVTLNASEVTNSSTGSLPTNFKFSDPVYIQAGVEYAILIESNNKEYSLATSKIGNKDSLITTVTIDKNKYCFGLAISKNYSSWLIDNSKDLKFNLNRANFASSGIVEFTKHMRGRITNFIIPENNILYNTGVLPEIIIEAPGVTATATASIVDGRVTLLTRTANGTNYQYAPLVTISAPPAGGTPAQVRAVVTAGSISSFIIINSGSGYTGAPIVTIDPPGMTPEVVPVIDPYTNKLTSITILNPGSGYTSVPVVTVTTPGRTNLSLTPVLEEVNLSTFNVIQNGLMPNKTSIVNSLSGVYTTPTDIIANKNYSLDLVKTIANSSSVNLTSTFNAKPNIDGGSNYYVSPVIDLERLSLVCAGNIINDDYIMEFDDGNGDASARYITRKISLNNPADRLDIFVNINRPSGGCDVKIYAKPEFDDNDDYEWIECDRITKNIPVSSDNKFSEIHYAKDFNKDFNKFAVKIVMLSDNPAFVPKLKDFRAVSTI